MGFNLRQPSDGVYMEESDQPLTHTDILMGVEKIMHKGGLRIHEREPSRHDPNIYFYRCNNDVYENISFTVTISFDDSKYVARIEERWRKERRDGKKEWMPYSGWANGYPTRELT